MVYNQVSQPRSGSIKVIVVAAYELVRAGIRSLLSGEQDITIVGEAIAADQARILCCRLQPDVVLIDLPRSDLDSLATIRAVTHGCSSASVLIMTLHAYSDDALAALRIGPIGYLHTNATRRELVGAVRSILWREPFHNGEAATRPLERKADETMPPTAVFLKRLTPREREVLGLLTRGQTNREIASNLSVSASTVTMHIERILVKLDAANRTHAVVRAIELGIHYHYPTSE
jgi:DNA-binding NarL/FixJ family response regulator